MDVHRDDKGQFATGNPGGPGRPRRTVERDYLAALTEIITLDDWRDIVKRALEQAKGAQGEKARNWITGLLLGKEPLSLTRLAVLEAGFPVEDEIQKDVVSERNSRKLAAQFDNELYK